MDKNIISDNDLKKLEAYNRLINRTKEYQKNNPVKVKEFKARYWIKMREENGEVYERILQKKREHYALHIKPQKDALRKEKKEKKEREKALKNEEALIL